MMQIIYPMSVLWVMEYNPDQSTVEECEVKVVCAESVCLASVGAGRPYSRVRESNDPHVLLNGRAV